MITLSTLLAAATYAPPIVVNKPGVPYPAAKTPEQHVATLGAEDQSALLAENVAAATRTLAANNILSSVFEDWQIRRNAAESAYFGAVGEQLQGIIDTSILTDAEQIAALLTLAQEKATLTAQLAQADQSLFDAGEALSAEQQMRIGEAAAASAAVSALNAAAAQLAGDLDTANQQRTAAMTEAGILAATLRAAFSTAGANDPTQVPTPTPVIWELTNTTGVSVAWTRVAPNGNVMATGALSADPTAAAVMPTLGASESFTLTATVVHESGSSQSVSLSGYAPQEHGTLAVSWSTVDGVLTPSLAVSGI